MAAYQKSGGRRIAALALAALGAATLSACEEHAYPSAAPREGTAAPAETEALAGAPRGYAPPPAPPPPGYGPPAAGYGAPPTAAPTYGEAPPNYAPTSPPPRPGYPPPPPPSASYPPGYSHEGAAPPTIVAMAPIPNPPEVPARHYAHRRWRQTYPAPYAWPHHHHHARHAYWTAAPAPVIAHPHRTRAAPVPAAAPLAVAPRPAPGSQHLTDAHAPTHHRHHHGAAMTAAAAAGAASQAQPQGGADAGSEAERYQALQAALQADFAHAGRLSAPGHMEANQPADVTLTLPSDFADTVQSEGGKQGLGQAASGARLTAALAGEGYAIVPSDPQTLMLAEGQATVFRWKVTPIGGSRGPLSVSLRLTPAGGDHVLDLGTKTAAQSPMTGRVVGIGLLAIVALVLLGWAAQRRRPAPTGAVKPRPAGYNPPPPPAI